MPFTRCKSSTLLLTKASPHNRAFSILYGCFDTGSCSSFIDFSLHINPPIWPKYFKVICQSKGLYPLLYCPATVHLDPLEPFDIVLLPWLWFLDSTSAMCASFIVSSLHNGYWHIFSQHWFSCEVMCGAVNLLSHKLVNDEIIFCIAKTGST